MDYGTTINHAIDGRWFGIQVYCPDGDVCSWPDNQNQLLDIGGVALFATDTTRPTITHLGSANLWNESDQYVRGTWPIDFKANADDGVCDVWAEVGGHQVQGPTSVPDQHSWTQCPDPQTWDHSVDTTAYPDGPLSLQVDASDAASPANVASENETVGVDNSPVTVSLSGPTNALSTAGTQDVTATASAGPSGVAAIYCSVDQSPFVRHAGASAEIPVQGIGPHQVKCYAQNHAINAAGAAATSSTATWSLSIRQPSVSSVSFVRIADALQCRRVTERVRIPARWVTVRSHGQRLHVRVPAQTRVVRVTRCKPKVVHRRIKVAGHWYTESLVVLPHTVRRTTVHGSFGARTTIDGWLGTARGTALGGQVVRIVTEPDVPGATFRRAATAVTKADGSWSTSLPPGPSRVVRVDYGGTATVAPASSGLAHVVVPASVSLAISSRRTHWGATVQISGRLAGCCVPAAGELVALRIGWRGGSADIGQVYARAHGRFHTSYTFLRGSGTAAYRIWATSAVESDYPYSPGTSRAVPITVGPP